MRLATRALAMSLWAWAAAASAALAEDALAPAELVPSTPEPPRPARAVRTNYLIPALESEALHLGFLAFSNLVTRESFARVSLDSIASTFDGRRPTCRSGWRACTRCSRA
jgi:hypothetical protein